MDEDMKGKSPKRTSDGDERLEIGELTLLK
jgi:hypothetical protein